MAERAYNVRISFIGQDKASGILGRIGGLLGRIGTIAGGILGANLFLGIGHQIGQMGRQAFEAVASYEQLGFTMESLIAREISRGTVVSTNSKAYATALAQEQKSWQHLTSELSNANTKLWELKSGYAAVRSEGDNTIGTQMQWTDAIKEQEAYIQRVKDSMAGLTLWNNRYADQMNGEVLMGTMSMSQAYEMASGGAKELLDWTQKLAIYSPFDMETVGNTIRMAMAYGFTTDQAKRLTKATVDYTAATGQGGEVSERIARALGQVQAKGRLMGEEIRQLTDASIPVVQILADAFGKSTEEITKMVRSGLIPADDAVNAILESMEGFEGVAERQFTTWRGLSNAMGDVKALGMQRVFSGIFEAFKPFAVSFIDFMTTEGFDKLEAFGTKTGAKLTSAFETIGRVWKILTTTDPASVFAVFNEGSPAIRGALLLRGAIEGLKDEFENLKEPAQEVAQYLDEIAVTLGSLLLINKVSSTWSALTTTLRTLGPIFSGIVSALGGPWAILAAAAIGILYWAWTNNIGGIQEIVNEFWTNTLQPFLESIVPWFQEHIPLALEWLGTTWTTIWTGIQTLTQTVWGIIESIIGFFVPIFVEMAGIWYGVLLPAFQAVGNYVGTVFTTIWTILSSIFQNVLMPIISFFVGLWRDFLFPALFAVWEVVLKLYEAFFTVGMLLWTVVKKALEFVYHLIKFLLTKAIEFITDKVDDMREKWELVKDLWEKYVVPVLKEVHEWLDAKLKPILAWLSDKVLPAFKTGLDNVSAAIEIFIGWIRDAIDWLNNLNIPAMFQEHSPSPFEQSLINTISAMQTLNSLPFMPQMSGVNWGSVAKNIRDINSMGLSPETGIPNTFGGTGDGTFIPGGGMIGGGKEVHYHIATTLSQEELIQVLEDIQRSEGNF